MLEPKKSKNIAVAKMGKTTQFSSSKWGAVGGDNECPLTILALAKAYPQHNFYIIGRCGIPKDYKLPRNLFYVLGEFAKERDMPMSHLALGNFAEDYQRAIITWLKEKNIEIDFGILHFGLTFSGSTAGNILKKDGNPSKALGAATQYHGVIIETLNQLNFPWVGIVTDPRQLKPINDLWNYPKGLIGQIDEDWHVKTKIWTKGVHHNVDFVIEQNYFGMENMMFIGGAKINQEACIKKGLGLLLNEGIKRGPILEEFGILDTPDVEIYGKWSDKWTEKYPNFKGLVKFEKINETIRSFKYTFCIPISKGWMTAKFNEMLHHGVFPFLHESYASRVKDHGIPEYFFVHNKEELFSKMTVLDNNPLMFQTLMNGARRRLSVDKYDGSYITQQIAKGVKRYLKEEL